MTENKQFKVKLVFENCEVLSVPGEYIIDLEILNPTWSVRRIAMNSISKVTVFNQALITVASEIANADKEEILKESFIFEHENFDVIDYLKRNDITNIDVINADGTDEEVISGVFAWGPEDDYFNTYQNTLTNDLGDVAILVSNKENPSKEFDAILKEFKEEFNDKDEQTFRKKLLLNIYED